MVLEINRFSDPRRIIVTLTEMSGYRNNVAWSRNVPMGDPDIWDDTELINAYDRAMDTIHGRPPANERSSIRPLTRGANSGAKRKRNNKRKNNRSQHVNGYVNSDGCQLTNQQLYNEPGNSSFHENNFVGFNFDNTGTGQQDGNHSLASGHHPSGKQNIRNIRHSNSSASSVRKLKKNANSSLNNPGNKGWTPPGATGDAKKVIAKRLLQGKEEENVFIVGDICFVKLEGEKFEQVVVAEVRGNNCYLVTYTFDHTQQEVQKSCLHRVRDVQMALNTPLDNIRSEISSGRYLPKNFILHDRLLFEPDESDEIPQGFNPPPFPVFSGKQSRTKPTEDTDGKSEEALATMLMSWYMSGYQTGRFQGLQSLKRSRGEIIK